MEGVQLGRLSYTSIGMIRGEIACEVPEEYDWTRFGAGGAISTLNDIISRMLEIPTPDRPRTTIVLGRIEGGTSASTIATRAALQFEVRSESGATVRQLLQDISEIIEEVSSQTGADIRMTVFARRRPGGIAFTHPLVRRTRRLMQSLSLTPRLSPSTSELSAFIDNRVPAVTVGLSSESPWGTATRRCASHRSTPAWPSSWASCWRWTAVTANELLASNTFHHSQFDLDELERRKREAGVTISLCIPTLNEERTIGKEIVVLKSELMERRRCSTSSR